jgi:hypothetical protein
MIILITQALSTRPQNNHRERCCRKSPEPEWLTAKLESRLGCAVLNQRLHTITFRGTEVFQQ